MNEAIGVLDISVSALLSRVSQFYSQQLRYSKEIETILKERNLNSKTLISNYYMGYSSGNLAQSLKADEMLYKLAQEIGLIKYDDSESFSNHIVIPIKDKNDIIDIAGINLKSGEIKSLITKKINNDILEKLFKKKSSSIDLTEKYELKYIEKRSGKCSITVKVTESKSHQFLLDTINLYSEKQRCKFAVQVAYLFDQSEVEVEQELFRLLDLIESGDIGVKSDQCSVVITEDEKEHALTILKSEHLFDHILDDLNQIGFIGESINKQLGYLAMTSRKTQNPLSLIIMSTSAAGKSMLQKTIFDCCPPEDRKYFTRLTPQSLYYLEENSLKHKFLSIEEEEGSADAGYALKILLSAKSINISTTGQDPSTGSRRTNEIKTEGPISLIVSTTKSDLEPELASRALIVTIDETKEQTLQIMSAQKEGRTLEGQLKKEEKETVLKKHHTIQRLLNNKLKIINNLVIFSPFKGERLMYRRGNEQYLNLIDSVAFLRQYQKEEKNSPKLGRYIEVDEKDIEIAKTLFQVVLPWYGEDLKPTTKYLLTDIKAHCNQTKNKLFSRKQIRDLYKWEQTNLHRHLKVLCDLDYIRIKTGQNGVKHVYELLLDDQ
jgi:DNA primase